MNNNKQITNNDKQITNNNKQITNMITGTEHNINNSQVSLLNRLKCDCPGIAKS